MPRDMCPKIAKIKIKTLPSEIEMSKICLVNSSIKVHGCTQVLMKLEQYRHICYSCFSKNGKAFPHAEADCKKTQKCKKRVNLGVSQHIGQKIVWNSTQKVAEKVNHEFNVPRSKYIGWLNTSNAFANVYNGRTHAQVVSKDNLSTSWTTC